MNNMHDVSIYTGDKLPRFKKDHNHNHYLGFSEQIVCLNKRHEILGVLKLPGLVDIKDLIFSGGYSYILSGLRDSVYILDENFNNFILAFNINKIGKLEFFKDRQKQCNEIPSNYFQIFYCPAMNNYYQFFKLEMTNNILSLISHANHSLSVNLNDFSHGPVG